MGLKKDVRFYDGNILCSFIVVNICYKDCAITIFINSNEHVLINHCNVYHLFQWKTRGTLM